MPGAGFFIAGALSALVPKESVTRYLGRNAPKIVAYPAAAMAGSTLAVCSCTIVPLFAGIFMKGAGIGPAITFLFFAPAGNILALSYTGVALGADFAIARVILTLVFGIGIGLIMGVIFRKSDQAHAEATDDVYVGDGKLRPATLVFLVTMVSLLIFGTLKVSFLLDSYASFTLPFQGMDRFQDFLNWVVPFDPSKGEEGVTRPGRISYRAARPHRAFRCKGSGRRGRGLQPLDLDFTRADRLDADLCGDGHGGNGAGP